MSSSTLKSLEQFIEFCQKHITGKERKEAQLFLDRFFLNILKQLLNQKEIKIEIKKLEIFGGNFYVVDQQ